MLKIQPFEHTNLLNFTHNQSTVPSSKQNKLLKALGYIALAVFIQVPTHSLAQNTTKEPQSVASSPAVSTEDVLKNYATIVHASYEDTLAAAKDLQKSIQDFLKAPSQDSLLLAKQSWLKARQWYGQTEAYRFYSGPIDNDKGPEGRLNAWPLDESYIDYVKGKEKTGLINNRKQPINAKALIYLNERGGEENIAAGWHAIEFMLWGQDLSETTAGARSFEDYIDGKRTNADRRRLYLEVVTQLLVDDLNSLVQAWQPDTPKNYRAKFEKGGKESLRKIFVGIGSLSRGELAGERMEVALASRNQEDEHSCFSDNTHNDVSANAKGIENVWLGTYQRRDESVIKGASLKDLVTKSNENLALRTTSRLQSTLQAAQNIQTPFDQEIMGNSDGKGRERLQTTVASLVQQSKDLVQAAASIGITKLTLVKP